MSRRLPIAITIGVAGTALAAIMSMSGCASWGRFVKTWNSDWDNGIEREVIVYDATGNELFRQRGKFDIEENQAGTKVLYDDEENMRHIVYLGSGTAIVNEFPTGEDAPEVEVEEASELPEERGFPQFRNGE